jgi:hypothetical protein
MATIFGILLLAGAIFVFILFVAIHMSKSDRRD